MLNLLLLLSQPVFAQDVLVLWDDPTEATPLVDSLTADGFTVTRSDTIEYDFDGTNPPLSGFDIVVHLNGDTYNTGMTSAII